MCLIYLVSVVRVSDRMEVIDLLISYNWVVVIQRMVYIYLEINRKHEIILTKGKRGIPNKMINA